MNMFKTIAYVLFSVVLLGACTDVEPLEIEHIGGHNTEGDSEYYMNLRAYKATAHNYGRPVSYGWFSNWSPTGAMRKGYLSSIPDSMDIVAMWSGAPGRYELTPDQKRDKDFVQKVKGTKLLEVCLLSHLGKGRTPNSVYDEVERRAREEGWDEKRLNEEKKFARWDFWGFTSHDLQNTQELEQALSRFAKAICDSLVTGEWDGYDIDWEPYSGFNDMDGTLGDNNIGFLVKELGKYIGPKSDPENKGHKLLCIDGHLNRFSPDVEEYVDYWITQSYGHERPILHSPGNRDEKLIIAENFESFAASGGQLLKQAAWMPENGYKGGVAAYRFENDYDNKPDYKWMRQAIQINQQVFNEWKKGNK